VIELVNVSGSLTTVKAVSSVQAPRSGAEASEQTKIKAVNIK